MPNVVCVVLHYENDEMTNKCVDSIHKTSDARVLVVDNNSPIEYSRSDIDVIRNNDRHAVSGMNFGFYYALYDMNSDFIVNFDNDIICLDGWLDPLLKVMEDPEVGIVGGKQWDKDQKHFRCVGMDLVGGHLYQDAPDKQCEVVWIQGSSVMMRGNMMRRIGIHDSRFKIICSDSDYCIHARDRGWKVVFTPDSNVIHIGGASYTSSVESWEEDNKKLLQKWSGMEATKLFNKFPLDIRNRKYLSVKYDVVEMKDV